MAGRLEGLSDIEWKLFEDLLPQPPEKRGRGMPHVPFRKVLNTQLYVLIAGCKWCDIPRGEQWASKSSAHRWLKRWYEDGALEKLKQRILAVAEEKGMIDWKYGAVDGSFSSWVLVAVEMSAMAIKAREYCSTALQMLVVLKK